MREMKDVNVELFREAVDEYNTWPARQELELVKIELGPDLKETTLQLFMQQLEAVPPERETEIPLKAVEIYNHLFDPAYVIPEGIFGKKEEVTVSEGTETEPVVEAKVEKPVKEKKERKPREPKEPKVKKESVVFQKDEFGFRAGGKCSLFIESVKANPGITMKEVRDLDWNTNHATYNTTLSKLKKEGKMKVESGKIYLV